MNNVQPGPNSVSEYQSSGVPWMKTQIIANGVPVSYEFPLLSRAITITATVQARVAFTNAGITGTNYFIIPANKTVRLEIKARRIWVAGDTAPSQISIAAELTGVESRLFPQYEGTSFASISSI